jgi:hypothetical protein
MKETQDVIDLLDSDPMEQFEEVRPQIEQMKQRLQVTSCSRVLTGPIPDSCTIHAVVTLSQPSSSSAKTTLSKGKKNKKPTTATTTEPTILQLTFRYARKERQHDVDDDEHDHGCHVRYSIDVSTDYGERESLLVVEVFARANFPSSKPAVCINDDPELIQRSDDDEEEDGWEDMDDDDIAAEANAAEHDMSDNDPTLVTRKSMDTTTSPPKGAKKQKNCEEEDIDLPAKANKKQNPPANGHSHDQKNVDESENNNNSNLEGDAYRVHLDPDVLHNFLKWANLMPMGEATAFFLLMTFPYYEHEWDLIGHVLDEVFGSGSDDEEEEDGE